jgi:hypothetical protein
MLVGAEARQTAVQATPGKVVSGGFFVELILGWKKCCFTGGFFKFVVHSAGKSWSICGASHG